MRVIDYADCHITAYSRYVRRTASLPASTGAHTLPFRDWFQSEYQALPGRYVGINYTQAAAQAPASTHSAS